METQDPVDRFLEACREVEASIVSREPHIENGRYKGILLTYKSGFQVYHPYVPLQFARAVTKDGEPAEPFFDEDEYPTEEEWRTGDKKLSRERFDRLRAKRGF
jgi:hypothetical protein